MDERTNLASSPLWEVLTIVVTTSPIKSNPSTEVIERTFDTFVYGGHDFAYKCRKVIICDGVRVSDDHHDQSGDIADKEKSGTVKVATEKRSNEEAPLSIAECQHHPWKVSRKHSNVKQALRNGIASIDQARKYDKYKQRLQEICRRANADDLVNGNGEGECCRKCAYPAFRNSCVVELTERHGYGFALREAVTKYVNTPYICVVQHDRTFMRQAPICETVHSMINSRSKIKYVGLSMRSNLMYRDIFISKYGKAAHEQLSKMIVRPPDLVLSSYIYGKNGKGVQEIVSSPSMSDKLIKNIISLQSTYFQSQSYSLHEKWIRDRKTAGETMDEDKVQLTLTPTFFWYDNIHIAETKHYRDFIFDSTLKMVARGGFVEDKVSPFLLKQINLLGLEEAHVAFGSYILDDHSGMFFTGHLDGGSYIGVKDRHA